MGQVYLAEDARLDRKVALKILPPEVAFDPNRMKRFIREAKAASALSHPHVAAIHDVGETGGISFIAMEFVEGETLAEKIRARPIPPFEIVKIAAQVADALDAAHSKGITHRDIKPDNLMMTTQGSVKVLDFGLAKIHQPLMQSASSVVTKSAGTQPGSAIGTINYMSPEQVLGHEVDNRSDLFSLGVVLYEMTTGRSPFAGVSAGETMDRILHAQPEPIPDGNDPGRIELNRITGKCLEKDREHRYQSARELVVDLKNLQRYSGSEP